MNQYKHTPLTLNALKKPKKRQINSESKVTFHDVVKSILIALFMVGLLLLISSYHQAHPKNSLQSVAGMGQNKDLSKSKSGMPNRYSLAFFVPKYRLTPQVNDTDSTTPLTHFTGLNRHIMPAMAASYDEVTPQNKIAEKRICGAVAFTTESEPCLTPFRDKQIIITQNVKGVVSHD